eukprot:Hpha_TRINITY_DN27906_c0_g1::TRINITY_DN27906_c0_g1_i1::g.44936::m.44936
MTKSKHALKGQNSEKQKADGAATEHVLRMNVLAESSGRRDIERESDIAVVGVMEVAFEAYCAARGLLLLRGHSRGAEQLGLRRVERCGRVAVGEAWALGLQNVWLLRRVAHFEHYVARVTNKARTMQLNLAFAGCPTPTPAEPPPAAFSVGDEPETRILKPDPLPGLPLPPSAPSTGLPKGVHRSDPLRPAGGRGGGERGRARASAPPPESNVVPVAPPPLDPLPLLLKGVLLLAGGVAARLAQTRLNKERKKARRAASKEVPPELLRALGVDPKQAQGKARKKENEVEEWAVVGVKPAAKKAAKPEPEKPTKAEKPAKAKKEKGGKEKAQPKPLPDADFDTELALAISMSLEHAAVELPDAELNEVLRMSLEE